MSTARAGCSIRTTRAPLATPRPHTGRAWPMATSANTIYDSATVNVYYRHPSGASPATAAACTSAAHAAPQQQQRAPSSRYSPSASPRLGSSHNRGVLFRTAPLASAGLPLPPATAAAQRGSSQQHPLPPAPPQVSPHPARHNRQPTLSQLQHRSLVDSNDRRSAISPTGLLSRLSASGQSHGSPAPSSQHTPKCPASAAAPSSSPSLQPPVSSGVASLMGGSHHRPPAPSAPCGVENVSRAAGARLGHARLVAGANSSRPLERPPPTSQTRRPVVYVEPMAAIADARPAPQSQLDTNLQTHFTTPRAAASTWRTSNDGNATVAASPQQQQPQPSLPLNYYALEPSLQLTQHRHVRHIVVRDFNSAPSSLHPQQQPVIVLVPQPRPAPPQQERLPRLYSSTTRPAGGPSRGAVQNNIYAGMAAEDTSSGASEVTSTRSSRTRQVFRRAPVTASDIPTGSPYGAMPTYAVVMPQRSLPAPPKTGASAASAGLPPPSAPAEAAQQPQHNSRCPPSSSRPSPQESRDHAAREQPLPQPPPQKRPALPQRHQPQRAETAKSQLPPRMRLPADPFYSEELIPEQRREGAWDGNASTQQSGHRGGHSVRVPSQQQLSLSHEEDLSLSAMLSSATVAAPISTKTDPYAGHTAPDGEPRPLHVPMPPPIIQRPYAATEEEGAPRFSVRKVTAPQRESDAPSPRHSPPAEHTLLHSRGAADAGEAAAKETREQLSAAKEAVTAMTTAGVQSSKKPQQLQHEPDGSPNGDDVDELLEADDLIMQPSRPQSSRHGAAVGSSPIQSIHSPQSPAVECFSDAPRSVHAVTGSETTTEQQQQQRQHPEPQLRPTSLGRGAVASAESDRCAAEEKAELTPPPPAQLLPTAMDDITERDVGEQSNYVYRGHMNMTLPQKMDAPRCGGSTAVHGATEGLEPPQDVAVDVMGTAEELREGKEALCGPSTGADVGPKTLQEADDTSEPTGASAAPLVLRERYVYVDPLEEASMDAAYMLDTLEQQYVRINEETSEEMEDVMHVVELNRYDRAAAMSRSFMPKGRYPDVLPMLRYPEDAVPADAFAATTTGSRSRPASSPSAGKLTYFPLRETAYLNLCATVWLSRFHTAEARGLLAAEARGPASDDDTAANGADHEGACPSSAAVVYHNLDHPSANLLAALDGRVSAHVQAFLSETCAGRDGADPCNYDAACVRLRDENNIGCLPHGVWAEAAPQTLSFADHVTNILLTATVPHEAERRRAEAARKTTAEEVAARRTWLYFLGASPWNYEVVAANDAYAAMPTAAARLAYAFMYKARTRNVDGGLGSLMFSMLSQQVPEAAFVDCLLMQEKLRLALLHSCSNIVACCALRQRVLRTPQARVPSKETPSTSASVWTSPVLSPYLTLYEGSATPPTRRPPDGASELFRLDRPAGVDEEASGKDGPSSTALCQHDDSHPKEEATPCGADERVDLYSVAVQLNYFFPTKTQRGMHQLCAALIEDLIAMDALPVPEQVVTPEGVVLTDRTSIVDALVVEGAQAMQHIIMTLSALRKEVQPETADSYRTLRGSIDTAAVWATMEKRLILFDPAIMCFLSTPVPVNDLFEYAATDGPPSMQPQSTGRKSWLVEVLRLQHVAETVQYTMEMQDAILVARQLNHLVVSAQRQRALAGKRDSGQQHGRYSTRSVAEELQMDAVVVGQSMDQVVRRASSASLLGMLGAGNGERTAADEPSLEDLLDPNTSRDSSDVSVRAVLVALCSADPEKPTAEVQEYLRHLLALYFEVRTPDGNTVDSGDTQQVAMARLMTAEMATWDWFGDTMQNGTLRAGAAPAHCDKIRVSAEELASLCPRVLGRRVGVASTVVADATAAVIAASTTEAVEPAPRAHDEGNDDDSVLVTESTLRLPQDSRRLFAQEM
ncbi:hypothetical protein LMJF_04_0900 [Leishmania major strain Friedlin]|uniref:Uncharacterized protein n=1 Tax=Leishmania major TaxID=5664 RepID=O97007_LEIMA|nr:hypothetical protein LMJF_04_0900 [Leishmania major strain Friedlin]CAC22634.1 hypothetical protein LMJF_04_0900 [Leishmania major strain Friedlin]CAG9567793.1 hypothetical_protein_-_conserved [Leishmania major strain Friedlin]|eukprot:XP_888601.1 hypothetical protein LMJF_04_0900 [Leishmania major strain Friedlin]